MKKNHEIRLRVTQQELEDIRKKAKELGMSVSSLARFFLKTAKVSIESK